ncbi:hypothetical protein [Vibrio vulnificus]|uniref:hypothetical protein n=1 Tax=Vibrio vulnificus TaxID=672 RepID=UPI001A26E0B4|nr:hypothetical protein [Vibrio vulnificus]MCG8706685.1 hypothetical protein [Vibrio vulnificus]HAS8156269.1 hypothetical protein [Vibrio vulnificus]
MIKRLKNPLFFFLFSGSAALITFAIYRLAGWATESTVLLTQLTLYLMIVPLFDTYTVTPRAWGFATKEIKGSYILLLSFYSKDVRDKEFKDSKHKIIKLITESYIALTSFIPALEVKLINVLFNRKEKSKYKNDFLTKIEPIQLLGLKVINDIASMSAIITLMVWQPELSANIELNEIAAFLYDSFIENKIELTIFAFIYLTLVVSMQFFMTKSLILQLKTVANLADSANQMR